MGERKGRGCERRVRTWSDGYERVVVRSAAWVAPRAGDLETGASLYRVCRFGWITQWGAMLVFRLLRFPPDDESSTKKTPYDLTEASVWVIEVGVDDV